jgi:hypothetical protein
MSISPSLDTSAIRTASRVFFICAILFICTLREHRRAPSHSCRSFEAAVIAEKAARKKRLAEARERDERRREADRQKAAEQAKAGKEKTGLNE